MSRNGSIILCEEHLRHETGQGILLHSICRPERIIEISRKFVVFDAGKKKVASYQLNLALHKILRRVAASR